MSRIDDTTVEALAASLGCGAQVELPPSEISLRAPRAWSIFIAEKE